MNRLRIRRRPRITEADKLLQQTVNALCRHRHPLDLDPLPDGYLRIRARRIHRNRLGSIHDKYQLSDPKSRRHHALKLYLQLLPRPLTCVGSDFLHTPQDGSFGGPQ